MAPLPRIGIVLFFVAAVGAAEPSGIDLAMAAEYFRQADAVCRRDAGELWGVSLCGPMLFADPATRQVAANRADAGGALHEEAGVHVGRLPADVNIANTALEWSGVRWTMLPWPLPEDPEGRAVLLMHESFHRVQPELGMKAHNPANAHLDSLEGRYWLQLEWRALAAALESRDDARLQAIADALAFRQRRRALFPDAAATENALERNEGLAEYTGVRLGAADPAARAAAKLRRAPDWPTFIRSFAYASGPPYGVLLDAVRPGWRRDLDDESDFGDLLGSAVELPPAEAASRAAVYDGPQVLAAETKRAEERAKRIADYRARLVDGPVLILPFQNMRISFDPLGLESFEDLGTVYPTLRVTDDWGILEVTAGGAFVDAGWSRAQVPAVFEREGAVLRGEGWSLRLEPGWTLEPGKREGDVRIRAAAD